jgi:3-hydroxyacyl-[acyl-carrier-protein] dehydratase
MKIPEDSLWFDGHFDGEPILPGVAHLALAIEACANGRELKVIRDVRFSLAIYPNDEIDVVAHGDRFEIRCNGKIATTGTLVFA